MTITLLILCLLGLAGYLLVSGFHDAPNAVAVAVRTRALTPMTALTISASLNFIGVLLSCFIFARYLSSWLHLPNGQLGLAMLATALTAQVSWEILTWWLRMPSSSTQALIGGLTGAAWALDHLGLASINPFTEPFHSFIVIPFILFPLLVFALSWFLVFPLSQLAQRTYPRTVNKISRNVLSLASSLISLTHGMHIGQRALTLFLVMLACANLQPASWVSTLASLTCALLLAAGTMLGGWRIGYTFTHKMVYIDPFRGSIAQATTALSMLLAQTIFSTSASSSHLAAASVLGAGLNQRFSSVRTRIVIKVLLTRVATMPMAFVISSVLLLALSPLLH